MRNRNIKIIPCVADTLAFVVQQPDRDQCRMRSHTRDALTIVTGRDNSGNMRAVFHIGLAGRCCRINII